MNGRTRIQLDIMKCIKYGFHPFSNIRNCIAGALIGKVNCLVDTVIFAVVVAMVAVAIVVVVMFSNALNSVNELQLKRCVIHLHNVICFAPLPTD